MKNGRVQLRVLDIPDANGVAVAHATVKEPVVVPEAKSLAVNHAVAAWMLGISRQQLWRRVNLPKKDARRIKRTSYGTYPVTELARHLAAELEEA